MQRCWLVATSAGGHPYRSVEPTKTGVPLLVRLLMMSSVALAIGASVTLTNTLSDGAAVAVLAGAFVGLIHAWCGLRLCLRSLSLTDADAVVPVGIAMLAVLEATIVLHADGHMCRASVATAIRLTSLASIHTTLIALTADFLRTSPKNWVQSSRSSQTRSLRK